jgi:hypothetical protein
MLARLAYTWTKFEKCLNQDRIVKATLEALAKLSYPLARILANCGNSRKQESINRVTPEALENVLAQVATTWKQFERCLNQARIVTVTPEALGKINVHLIPYLPTLEKYGLKNASLKL